VIIVAYAPDLADRSRIEAALPEVTFVKSLDDLGGIDADIVILDLSRTPDFPPTKAPRVIGYGSHIDDELLTRARAAGIDAMPRSRFFRDVAAVLRP
jgi:hypothetical protein